DGPKAKARDAVHVVFACEKMHPQDPVQAPDVTDSENTPSFRLVSLDALVRMKLTAFWDKDRTHLRDLIGVGLVDPGWLGRLPLPLQPRLKDLLDNPEG